MSLAQAIGLTVLPNVCGIVGGLISRGEIKNWLDVIFYLNGFLKRNIL